MIAFEKTAAVQQQTEAFLSDTEKSISSLAGFEDFVQISELQRIRREFARNIADFYRNDRKLNIGVIGQVKAGKSTFLNTLLFGGNTVLPAARTPKTAILTKIEYSETNQIVIEYYQPDEWQRLKEFSLSDLEDNEHEAAREIMKMAEENGIDPEPYLNMGTDTISFPSLDSLMEQLNQYVGENGKFTPIVKSVTIFMNKPELEGISVVDTPGLNDAIISRTDKTREFIGQCDVVFFLSRGSQFVDANDMKLISNQFPQKGVVNLFLICSRFDEALLDELRKCGSLQATIDKVKVKLTEKAQTEFMNEDKTNFSAAKFLSTCSEPIFISSLLQSMLSKEETDYSANEAHIKKKLNRFGDLSREMMQTIGNFSEVTAAFEQVVATKDSALQEKSKNFIPAVTSEWNAAVKNLLSEASQRKALLETGDKDILEKQKKAMVSQISGIKAALEEILGEMRIALEQTKGECLRQLRENCRERARIQEKTGTESHVNRYKVTTGHLWWKKSHYEYSTYTTTYTYLDASDALENIRSFGYDSCSQIESSFRKAIDVKTIKRKLLQTILDHFDSSDENFDINHFRLLAETALNRIEFPVIKLDTSSFMQTISNQFSGEVKDSTDKAKLQKLLSDTIDHLFENVSAQFIDKIAAFRVSLDDMQNGFSNELLQQINQEFSALCDQLQNKKQAISQYEQLITLLTKCSIGKSTP